MKKKKLIKLLVLVLILVVFSRIAFHNGLTVRKYSISSPFVSEPHTFVVVSDLHSTEYGENQSRLLQLIDSYAPDAILMPGDFASQDRPIDGSRTLMEKLSKKYPCYLTVGNHERWSEVSSDMKAEYASYGVCVLSDDTAEFRLGSDTFRIHGVDDPLFYDSEESFRNAVESLQTEEDVFDILLSHRPEYAELYASRGFELAVCGHAHGGQVRIPFLLNGLYAPHQGWFPPYAGGMYELGNTLMAVSRGLMIDDIPRVFNPPEIVIITVTPLEP